jgi:hypothetical protein
VVASDTGGNRTSQSFNLEVLPDVTSPSVLSFSPPDASVRGTATGVVVHFNETVNSASAPSAFTLVDGPGSAVPFKPIPLAGGRSLAFTPLGPLAPGSYTATLATTLTDFSGNGIATPLTWSFEVYDVANDSDADCLPDDVEAALGLDPLLADSDNNGTLDGDEDSDGDGLINCREVLLGTGADSPDSDSDRLLDGAEVAAGTDPLDPDTDDDGFLDGEEDEFGSDPNSSGSVPTETTSGYSQVALPSFSVRNDTPPPLVPYSTSVTPVVGVENQNEPAPSPP